MTEHVLIVQLIRSKNIFKEHNVPTRAISAFYKCCFPQLRLLTSRHVPVISYLRNSMVIVPKGLYVCTHAETLYMLFLFCHGRQREMQRSDFVKRCPQ